MRRLFAHIRLDYRLRILFWAAILFLPATAAKAEHLPVKIYTSADGLGSSASFNLVRDARGFIWLCSRDGLVRFDGYRFITYRIGNYDADPSVFDLIPTSRAGYWIDLNRGTDYRFIPPSEETPVAPVNQTPAKNDPRIHLNAEPLADSRLPNFEDEAGNLWTSDSKGIYLMREENGQTKTEAVELFLPGNPASGISSVDFGRGQSGGFWIGTNWGLIRRLPDGKMIHYRINPQNNSDLVRYFAEDKSGRVWIARPEGLVVLKVGGISDLQGIGEQTARAPVIRKGVVNHDSTAQPPEQIDDAAIFSFADILRRDVKDVSNADYLKPEIYEIICASDGKMWFTSNHGLIVFDGKQFHQYTTAQGLGSNVIASIAEDNEGHLWLASYGGLHRLNPKGLTTFDETDGLERARIHSIYEDRNGELIIISGNFNISRYRDGGFQMVRPQLPAGSMYSWQSNAVLLDSRGDWWINTQDAVYRYSGVKSLEELDNKSPTAIYNEASGLLSNFNIHVFEDSSGDIWISPWVTSKKLGLTRWQRSTNRFESFLTKDGLPEKPVAVAFAEDAAGNHWFGFTEDAVARYRNGKFTVFKENGAPATPVTNIYRDKIGRLWIATSREGLFRVDNPTDENPVFKQYTIADGLTSNNIRCVTEDFYGNIYIGTVRGVNRLSPGTGRVKYYGTSDGLASDFINTVYRDRSGVIWVGTFNGLSRLVPEQDAPLQPPTVLISGLRIAGEDYSVSPLGQRQVLAPEQSANRNNLQIDFLSVNTGGNASTRYQYKLEGVDADWSEPTAQSSVTFANLSPGAYHFLVRALNADDVASEQPAIVSFTVLRPVWQRWWFLTTASVLIGLAIYALYRYRIEQVIKLERVRTRIATDLHDDIGSSLSKIAILSEVVRQKTDGNGASEPLEIIANTSREMVDSMSDIVWAINPERDSLSDLVHRMRRFAEDILDAQDIDYQFLVPEHLKEISLGADVRRDVYLIFKECVNNLAKHSEATEAEIKINLERDNLTIEIKDNGRGFSVPTQTAANEFEPKGNGFGGNGLRNMRRRTANFGGDLLIDAEPEKGTRIVLQVPVHKKIFAV